MSKVIGKVIAIDFKTIRYCSTCEAEVKKRNDSWYCPNCGLRHWRKTRRVYFLRLWLDVFDTKIVCMARDNDMDRFLNPVGLSLRTLADTLSNLRGFAWRSKNEEIREIVHRRLWQKYGEQVIELYGEWYDGKGFFIKRVKPTGSAEGEKFVEGTQSELLEITRSVLNDHEEKLELWGNTPILYYTRNIRGETVQMGIRAPVKEYGKAYHLWVRVNDVPMIPTTPVYVGGSHKRPAYVYRIYHTQNWKGNLRKKLQYCVSREEFLVDVAKASRAIHEGEENLWDLVNRISRFNTKAAIEALKKHGLLRNEFDR